MAGCEPGKAARCERTIAAFVPRNLDIGNTVPGSDELPAGRWIGRKFPAHLRLDHSAGEYVRHAPHAAATAHLNTAESFAALERAVIGVWHWFSMQHPDRHLHEVVSRWNRLGADARLAALFPAGGRPLRRSDRGRMIVRRYPTRDQAARLHQWAGSLRCLWNRLLERPELVL